jgi:hypothetical protein
VHSECTKQKKTDQAIQESKKSKTEEKDNTPEALEKSIRVFKNHSLKLQHTPFRLLKASSVSFPPQTPENAKRDHILNFPNPDTSATSTATR